MRPFLLEIVAVFAATSFSADGARVAIIGVFEALTQPSVRTSNNCALVERCLAGVEAMSRSWPVPNQFRDFLRKVDCLHDAVSSPAIADQCGSLPEQLLAEARNLGVLAISSNDRGLQFR